MIGPQSHCRLCKSTNLETYLDLGEHVPSDSFRTNKDEKQVKYPLEVNLCLDCGLSQLSYVVDPKVLYQNEYPYESSTTEGGKRHYFEFADSVVDKFKLTKDQLVVDIGANVGVLLEGFKNHGVKVLGIDPAQNIVDIANERGIETICEFFGEKVATQVLDKYGSASVITGTNVFAHVDNLDDFIAGVKILLNNNGVFIFESPFFSELVSGLEYDTCYHEHLSYLSLKPVIKFMERHGLEVFHVEERSIHGGSVRTYVARKGTRFIGESVGQYLSKELDSGIHDINKLREFASNVELNRIDLSNLLSDLKSQGKSIALLSCPAKNSTLLQYCQLGNETFDFATEKSKLKIGRFTPGSSIEVFGDDELLKRQPDYAFVGAWNFLQEIMKNNKEYENRGGRFITHLPKPRII